MWQVSLLPTFHWPELDTLPYTGGRKRPGWTAVSYNSALVSGEAQTFDEQLAASATDVL